VVSVIKDILGEEWLGREIDDRFIKDLKAMGNIDFCGEKGEFHTFVYDGPIFKKPVEFTTGKKMLKNNHWFLEVMFKGK
jgi:diphthamide synthase (EF-2-diphthine--ammonia ligase)